MFLFLRQAIAAAPNTLFSTFTKLTVRKTRTTVDRLAMQFDEVFDAAMGEKQLGAAGSAAAAKAMLFGFMRDRLEVGGVGEFDDCKTLDDIGGRMIDDADGDVAKVLADIDAVRALVEGRAAARATTINQIARRPKMGHLAASSEPRSRSRVGSTASLAAFDPGEERGLFVNPLSTLIDRAYAEGALR
jgi:hypothetical protein